MTAVKARDFVSWASSKGDAKGRVKSVHKGKVPALPVKVEGTDLDPAARVEVYTKQDGGWVPTGMYVGVSSSKLTAIGDLPDPSTTEAVAQGSFDEIRRRVQAAIEDKLEAAADSMGADLDGCVYVWVCDIGPDWAVYNAGMGDDQFRVTYSIADDSTVTLGEPVEVQATTTYEPVNGDPGVLAPGSEATVKRVDRVAGKLLEAKGADADGSRIFAVQIIATGDSKNGNRYPQSVLESAAPLYEGAKAFDHHRTEAELRSSTITGLVGSYRNVEATAEGLFGDLYLLPSAKHTAEALDASLAAQESGLKPLVGISHDVEGLWRNVVEGSRRLREATQIVSVNSADVVADPAAGGRATRMVAGGITTTEGGTVETAELIAALDALTTEQREQLGVTYNPPSSDSTATEAIKPSLERDGIFGRLAVESAMKSASLPGNFAEAVLKLLPERFSESELPTRVAHIKDVFSALERTGMTPTVASAEVTKESRDKKTAALDLMFGLNDKGQIVRPGGYSSFKEAWADFTEFSTRERLDSGDVNRRILAESCGNGAGFDSQYRATESVSTTTFNTALGDSVTRRMVAEYQQPNLQAWQAVVSSTPPVNDFRTQRIERMGGYGVLPTVNQGAPYNPLTTPGNEEVTYALTKKGGTEDLTLEAIANDDLRLIQRIPVKLGLAAAQTLYRFVFDFFNANPSIYDSTNLFAAGHNNTDTNALSQTNLSVGRKKMRKQAAYGDTTDILSIVPKYLVAPPSLEELAFQLCTSAVAIPATPAGPTNTPNIHQGLTPIIVDYFDATSATEWFLAADPGMCPTIEIGFYQGRQDPDLLVQADAQVGSVFTADKITYKIRHIYSGAVLDFRGLYRGNT